MTDIDVSHYNTGTATIANGDVAVVGQGTTWTSLRKGDMFGTHVGDGVRILEIIDETHLTLAYPWTGPSQTEAVYEIQRTPYDIGYLQRLEELITLLNNGNLESLAGLLGAPDQLPIFTGPGTFGLIDKSDLVSGIEVNGEAEDMAGRAVFDNEPAGFLVYVADVGNSFGPENVGRAAIFYKKSNALADWSDPGYVTGPIGPAPVLEIGTVTTGLPGTNAVVTLDPITGGYEIDFTIPAGAGFYWQNAYNPANEYAKDFVVRSNGSSFIALQAVPAGEAPSGAFPPADTAYWAVLASKGADGLGTGDFVGPNSAVDGNLVAFDGSTGKLGADSGVSVDDVVTSADAGTDLHIAVYDGASKQIKDGGLTIAEIQPTGVVKYNEPQSLNAGEIGQALSNISARMLANFHPVINGNFDVWQRSVSTTAGAYSAADRYFLFNAGNTVTGYARQAFTLGQTDVPGNPSYYARITFTTALAATSATYIGQFIEKLSTYAGKRATFTFWARADGTRQIAPEFTQYFGTGGSALESRPLGAITVTPTWQKFSVTVDVPSVAGKVLGTGASYCSLIIWLSAGANYATRASNIGQIAGGQYVDIARVSFVEGDATSADDPYPVRSLHDEIALCRRTYTALDLGFSTVLDGNSPSVGTYFTNFMALPVQMRAVPNVTANWNTSIEANIQSKSMRASASALVLEIRSAATGRFYATPVSALLDAEFF